MEPVQKLNRSSHTGIHSADFWIGKGFTIWEATQLSKETRNTTKHNSSRLRKDSLSSIVDSISSSRNSVESTKENDYTTHIAFNPALSNEEALLIHTLELKKNVFSNASVSFSPPVERIRIVEPANQLNFYWLAAVPGGVCSLICTSALIFFGAQSGGFTGEAWFWSALLVTSSTTLISLPLPNRWRDNWFEPISYKALGLFLLTISYCTMHAHLSSRSENDIASIVANSSEVIVLEKQIEDLKNRLDPTRKAIAALDFVQYRTTIARMLREAGPLEQELKAATNKLVEVKKTAALKGSTGARSDWALAPMCQASSRQLLPII